MLGTLYGIGVGPGDPELLTLKAVNVLKRVTHIFAAASSKNDYSLALDIVADHIKPGIPVDHLAFPMTFDRNHMEHAWQANCEQVVEVLSRGENAAFLTIGDPLTFSTYIYLVRKVSKRLPEARIVTIPGITSFQAAASCANIPLAEGEESFTVISAAKGGHRLEEVLEASDNVILLKTYKQLPEILSRIERLGLKDSCCFISRCGLDGQVVERDFVKLSQMTQPHYLSLMIVKKRGIES